MKDLIKEIILEELGLNNSKKQSESTCDQVDTEHLIGKLVMIRTYSAGVHFGTLAKRCGKEVMLTNSHRVHYWTNACSLSQLSQEGSKNKNSENRISIAVPEIILTEAIEIIPMPKETFESMVAHLWKK